MASNLPAASLPRPITWRASASRWRSSRRWGGKDYPEEFIRAHVRPNVTLTPIRIQGRPTTRKLRYVELGYLHKLFEVYTMDDTPLDEAERKEIDRITAERVRGGDVVIVTDFGHGMIAPSTIDALIANSKFLAVNAQSNSGNHGYNLITKYPRADYICIDAPEARLAATDKFNDIASVIEDRPARQDRLRQHDHHARLLRLLPLLVEDRRRARARFHQDRRRHGRRRRCLPDDHGAAGGRPAAISRTSPSSATRRARSRSASSVTATRSKKAPLVKFVTALLK